MNLTKKEIRNIALTKRKALSSTENEILSQQIVDLFLTNFSLTNINSIHIFLPIQHQNEINTLILIKHLQDHHPKIKIIVPKIINNTNKMLALELSKDSLLINNKWGIPEPQNEVLFDSTKIDLIILPLLGFDKDGNRVGYGKGFYDVFLTHCKSEIIRIGFCIGEAYNQIADIESHDQKLNFIITNTQIFKFI